MRIILKVGSNILTKPDGRLFISRIAELVDEITELSARGHEFVLVTSGAVAAGRSQITLPEGTDRVERRQVLSSVGQALLIDTYRALFNTAGQMIGQILVTKSDFSTAGHVETMRQCFNAQLANHILPVVNENDTVSVESLMFTDNDELAGLIAKLLKADLLIILTSVDGLYDGDPTAPNTKLIKVVHADEDLSSLVQASHTSAGRGGMQTKLNVATQSIRAGIPCVIANGTRHQILAGVIEQTDTPCTRFVD